MSDHPTEVDSNNPVKRDVDLDRILSEEVGFGMYQIRAMAFCCFIIFFAGISEVDYVFTAARLRTRCIIPECEVGNEQQFSPSWISYAVPQNEQSFDNCHRYSFSNSSFNESSNWCEVGSFDKNKIEKCEEYAYENKNSAVYDFNFPCDEWRWFLIGSLQVVGMAIALPATGYIADRWGRRLAVCIFAINYAWINIIAYWSTSYTIFLICGFLGSFFGLPNSNTIFVLLIELLSPNQRIVVTSTISSFYCTGTAALGLLAWTEPHWRHLILILYLPMFISVAFYWILPESIRWLVSVNRYEESKDSLVRAAKMNGRVISDDTLKCFSGVFMRKKEKPINEDSVISLVFKNKKVLLLCILTPIWWGTAVFINNSLLISSVGISGNKYVNFSATAAIGFPGFWLATFVVNRIGRKPVLISMYWLNALCQLAYIFIPKDDYALRLGAYLLGKFSMGNVVSILYMYTSELFPTSHRSTLTTFASMVGRLGAFAAPISPAMASQVWEHLPFVVMAALAFATGLLVLPAPETAGAALPETMEDVETLGKDAPSPISDMLRRILSKKRCYSLR